MPAEMLSLEKFLRFEITNNLGFGHLHPYITITLFIINNIIFLSH